MTYKSEKPDPTEIDGHSEHSLGAGESLLLGKHGPKSSLLSNEAVQDDQLMGPDLPRPVKSLSPGKQKQSTLVSRGRDSTPRLHMTRGVPTYDQDDDDDTSERDESSSSNDNLEDESTDPESSKSLEEDGHDSSTHCTRMNPAFDTTSQSGPLPRAAPDDSSEENESPERDDSSSFQDEPMDPELSNVLGSTVKDQGGKQGAGLSPPSDGEESSSGGEGDTTESSLDNYHVPPEAAFSLEALDDLVEGLFTPEVVKSPLQLPKSERKKSKTESEEVNPWMSDGSKDPPLSKDAPLQFEILASTSDTSHFHETTPPSFSSPQAEFETSGNEMPSVDLFQSEDGVKSNDDDKDPDPIPTLPDYDAKEFGVEDKDSLSELKAPDKRERISQTTLILVVSLVCLLIFLAAIAGGIVGAFVFGNRGETREIVVYVTNAPMEQVTAPPTSEPPTTTPTIAPSTASPTIAPTTFPTESPTSLPTAGPLVTNQDLFDTIAEVSFDGGESIRVPNSPQQRAFTWIQNVDTLTNNQRRKLRGNNRRRLALSRSRIVQRYAMATIYYSTNGEGWARSEGWLDPVMRECEWESDSELGSGCTFLRNQMQIFQFNENDLVGALPPEVALLSNLRRLEIVGKPDGGRLSGRIPSEIGLITNLEFLKIRGHDLAEELPNNLFENMGSLTTLNLSSNNIPGSIPASVANLTKVLKILLNDNRFSKGLPDGIAVKSLTDLQLQNNLLTGFLPPTFANQSFESFDVSNNAFSGPLPDFSGWSTLREKLDFSDNNFTGALLDRFGPLGDLRIFRASNNRLSGGIPPSVAALESLEEMDLSGNNIEGNVTEEMCSKFENNAAVVFVDCGKVDCDCCTGC
eukprot:scaffold630_cov174-Amphora_coffeaeformis.AAC.15